MSKPQKRAYSSGLRDAQAAQTRDRIYAAAADVLAANGYGGATLAEIARRAGVSVESVKAAGSKAELLLHAFEMTFGGVAGAQPLESRQDLTALRQLSPERFLSEMLTIAADANARAGGLWLTFLGAAPSDALVAEALNDIVTRRAADYRTLAMLVGANPHSLMVVMSVEAREMLVSQSGLTDEEYRQWLSRTVNSLINEKSPAEAGPS